jgi:hypothetical protein
VRESRSEPAASLDGLRTVGVPVPLMIISARKTAFPSCSAARALSGLSPTSFLDYYLAPFHRFTYPELQPVARPPSVVEPSSQDNDNPPLNSLLPTPLLHCAHTNPPHHHHSHALISTLLHYETRPIRRDRLACVVVYRDRPSSLLRAR